MSAIKNIQMIILIFLTLSCTKMDEPPLDDDQSAIDKFGKLDTIWTAKLIEDQSVIYIDNLLFYQNNIFVVGALGDQAFVSSYDSKDGKINWFWDLNNESSFPTSSLVNKKMICQKNRNLFLIDIENGEANIEFRELQHASANTFGQVIGDYFYRTIRKHDNSIGWLVRSNYLDLQIWDTVYTLEQNQEINNLRPNVQSYNLWVEPSTGDSILIFQHRMIDRVDVVAWNMDKKEVVWRHDDITPNGNSNHQQILIQNDKAYFGGSVSFFCFDMRDGEIVWRFDDNSGHTPFMGLRSVVAKSINALVVTGSRDIFAFDIESGMIKWRRPFEGSISSGSPVYHDGIIYITGRGLLYAYRASDGELLWAESSSGIPLGPKTFQGELAIDRERGILYATSSDRLFAIRVYED